MGRFRLYESIHKRQRPNLELVFQPEKGQPFVEDKPLPNGPDIFRVFRVAIINSGEPVEAAVKILACVPQEPQAPRIGYSLQAFGAQPKVDKVTVNRSHKPLVFFEVLGQRITPGVTNASDLHLRAAIDNPNWKYLRCQNLYLVTLAIDGRGANEPQRFIVMRAQDGKYVLQREPTP